MVPQHRTRKVKMKDGQPNFLTPAQVVTRWNDAVTTGTLANWRSNGKGPPFQKFGSRVRYPLDKLVAWEDANQHAMGKPANDNTEGINTNAA